MKKTKMLAKRVPPQWKGADFKPVDFDAKVAPLKMRLFRPSMSHTDLLLACQWPFGKEVPVEPTGPEAEFGNRFHAKIAGKPVKTYAADPEVDARVKATRAVLDPWLRGENPWRIDWTGHIEREKSFAIGFTDVPSYIATRPVKSPNVEHVYEEAKANELPGTADLLAASMGAALLVLDYKTGRDVGDPAASGQLLSLMTAWSCGVRQPGLSILRRPKMIIGFVHAPADARPAIYPADVDEEDIDRHIDRLRGSLSKIGDGYLRPGSYCKTCPARMICPTQTNELATLKAPQGQAMTGERVGAIMQALGTYDNLREKLKVQVRDWVEANGPAPRPDGKIVDLVPRRFTNLSQASILRALGPIEGGKVVAMLRETGCIEEGERLELRSEDERGR